MTDKKLIDTDDYENGFDNPNLNYVESSVIFVQSKSIENEEFQDPFTLQEFMPINPNNLPVKTDDYSSSDSIEVVTLEDVIPRPISITKNSDQKDVVKKEIKHERNGKEEKFKLSKESKLSKKEIETKMSINIFEEQYSFVDLIDNSNSITNIIDPKIYLLKFLFTPPPKNVVVKCQLNKTNKKDKTMMFTKFIFSMQISNSDENDQKNLITLMAARLRKKSRTINYIISTDASEMNSKSSSIIGKMKGNFLGSKFTLLYNKRPLSASENYDNELSDNESETESTSQIKKEKFEIIGAVFYKSNSVIKRKPRVVDVVIPEWNEKKEEYTTDVTLPNDRSEFSYFSNVTIFNNITPSYDKEMKCFTLNFGGRAKCISSKNFALQNKEKRIYQFGKCKNHYIVDYTYPLCAFQAFAIGLSSCHRKLTTD